MDLARLSQVPRAGHLRELFADDPRRADRYVVEVGDLRVDYSKQRVTDEILAALLQLAEDTGVVARRDAMFAGQHLNTAEDRAAGHVALRMPRGSEFVIDGINVVADVHAVLDKMVPFWGAGSYVGSALGKHNSEVQRNKGEKR